MKKHDCLKETVEHFRGRLKQSGIKASVVMMRGGDHFRVQPVGGPYVEFTPDEQRTIRTIAVCNKLTWVHQLPIVVEQMTEPFGMYFYLSAEMIDEWRRNIMTWPNGIHCPEGVQ